MGVVALLGMCLWAAAFVHPSRKVPFESVPLRSVRPQGVRVALLVAVGLVVPAVLSARAALGVSDTEPALTVGSTILPTMLVLYLLHQVFTHAAAEYRAQHDSLTGVCNRLLFEDRLQRALVQADKANSAVSVMFLDLDRFKDINDSLGHAVGNDLLKAVVKRLQGCLREHDTLARFGGDEFTFLIPDSGRKDGHIVDFAERLLDRFEDPFSVGGRQLTVKASIGVAVSPWDGADADTLLKHADTAMYQAKAAGRNTYQVFDSAMSARARLRYALEDSLRAAVEMRTAGRALPTQARHGERGHRRGRGTGAAGGIRASASSRPGPSSPWPRRRVWWRRSVSGCSTSRAAGQGLAGRGPSGHTRGREPLPAPVRASARGGDGDARAQDARGWTPPCSSSR